MTAGFLRKCSVAYLLLPNLLFSGGWFRQPYSSVLILGYLCLLFVEFKKKDKSHLLSYKDIFAVAVCSLVLVFFSGVNGYSTQSFDWQAHNTKFYDLYKNRWPIYFEEVGRYACYYFGYYLVPAFFSKLFNSLLPEALVFWTFLGVFLGISWIYTLLNKSKLLLFLFFFLRGTGQLVNTILGQWPALYIKRATVFNPTLRSLFEHNMYVPNQLIPVFICCGIMLYDFITRKRIEEDFFLISLVFVWGAFSALSLLGILFIFTLYKYLIERDFKGITTKSVGIDYIIPGLLFIPTFVYFLSSQGSIERGFLWSYEPKLTIIISYLTGAALDLVMFYVLAVGFNNGNKKFPVWIISSMIIALFLLSLYRMGKYNDTYFRGSTPISIIIFIVILRGVYSTFKDRKWPSSIPLYPASILMAFLVVTQIVIKVPILRDNRIANHFFGTRNTYRKLEYDNFENTYQVLINGYHDEAGAKQYLAAKNSWYEKYLSR